MKDPMEAFARIALKKAANLGAEARLWRDLADALSSLPHEAASNRSANENSARDRAPNSIEGKIYLTTNEAAKFLGLSRRTLEAWRFRGGGPAFKKIGGAVRYKITDLENFAQDRSYPHTSAYRKNDREIGQI